MEHSVNNEEPEQQQQNSVDGSNKQELMVTNGDDQQNKDQDNVDKNLPGTNETTIDETNSSDNNELDGKGHGQKGENTNPDDELDLEQQRSEQQANNLFEDRNEATLIMDDKNSYHQSPSKQPLLLDECQDVQDKQQSDEENLCNNVPKRNKVEAKIPNDDATVLSSTATSIATPTVALNSILINNNSNHQQNVSPLPTPSSAIVGPRFNNNNFFANNNSIHHRNLHHHLHHHHGHHHHHHHHPIIRPQISLQTTSSSSAATATTATTKKSPKKIKGQLTYQRPPDGGWGWMVVFASFVINLITDGVSFSFGVIYVELVDYFNESKSKTAWVGSLFLSIPNLTGPIASALVDHFGCRKVTIAGALLAALGFFVGQFATCVEHLFIAFSLSGFGFALCYVTSIVSVAYWFDKRRSLATGLSVCGTGFGTFLFPPFIIFLLKEYKWRGTLLILSAVFLNMICCGFLIRDLNIDPSAASTSSSSSSSSSSTSENTSDLESSLSDNSVDEADDLEMDNQNNQQPLFNQDRHCLLRTLPLRTTCEQQPQSACCTADHDCNVDDHHHQPPRHTASLISIPTFVKNNHHHHSINKTQNLNNNSGGGSINSSTGELTFRRGGYLHNLICYYPHLLAMFLPWDMQCDDLTVKTKMKSILPPPTSPVTNVNTPSPLNVREKVVGFGSTHHMDSNPKLNVVSMVNNNGVVPGNDMNNPDLYGEEYDAFDEDVFDKTNMANGVGKNPNQSGMSRFGQLFNFGRQPLVQQQQDNLLHNSGQPRSVVGNRLHNLRLPRGSLTYRNAMLVINKYRLKASSAPDIYRTSMATINEEKGFNLWHSLKEILWDMFDVSNFKSVRYTIFCLSNFLLYLCIDVPYVYIPDQVITTGVSDKDGASKYISILGVFNTIGVVFVGYIGDKPWIDVSYIYALLISISGVTMFTIPLTKDNYIFMVQSAIYGFSISANYSLVSVILVELISLDSFTNAYGMLLLVQGIGSLVGPPLAGWVYDVSGNYDSAFYIVGVTILLSGLLVIPVGKTKNCSLFNHVKSKMASTKSSQSNDDEDGDEDTTSVLGAISDGGSSCTSPQLPSSSYKPKLQKFNLLNNNLTKANLKNNNVPRITNQNNLQIEHDSKI